MFRKLLNNEAYTRYVTIVKKTLALNNGFDFTNISAGFKIFSYKRRTGIIRWKKKRIRNTVRFWPISIMNVLSMNHTFTIYTV